MPQIVLYFPHSTSVLSFYIDIALTPSILCPNFYMLCQRLEPHYSTRGLQAIEQMSLKRVGWLINYGNSQRTDNATETTIKNVVDVIDRLCSKNCQNKYFGQKDQLFGLFHHMLFNMIMTSWHRNDSVLIDLYTGCPSVTGGWVFVVEFAPIMKHCRLRPCIIHPKRYASC